MTRVESLGLLRSEEHTSELQSPCNIVCRLLLEKKIASLFFQRVRGYDPLGVGLAFLPFSLSIAILSFASGALITRFGDRSVLLPSLPLMGVGLLYFSRVPVEAAYAADVLPALFLLGVGFGPAFP